MTIEKLSGRTSGATRADLREFAMRAAVGYYAALPRDIRITLSNVETLTIDQRTHADPTALGVTGYQADFTAEVIEP